MDAETASPIPINTPVFLVQITQTDYTEMAWQAIVASPEVAKESKQQIVETEHLMKALLEQRNGLARRIFAKAGADNTSLLQATDRFIQRQPKVGVRGFLEKTKMCHLLAAISLLTEWEYVNEAQTDSCRRGDIEFLAPNG